MIYITGVTLKTIKYMYLSLFVNMRYG